MSHAITRQIEVSVAPTYHPEHSEPGRNRWFFSYTIRITNHGADVVQLLSRHWIITNAHGVREEVRGSGVVGEQPVLAPGEHFEYTSFCPLSTSLGSMEGSYQIVNDAGERFDVKIPPFALVDPSTEQ
jgi:ApaG protein